MLTSDQVRAVVETATLAPSVHNTQPWRFASDGTRVDVHADPERVLRRQDPDGRELLISCGAASLLAELAVRGLGRSCTVEVLPDPADQQLVARGCEVTAPRELVRAWYGRARSVTAA
jgi:hypothetical protein